MRWAIIGRLIPRLLVSSSSSINDALCKKARVSFSLCRSPPERVSPSSPTAVSAARLWAQVAATIWEAQRGDTLTFCKADGEWILERGGWKTVWSKSGNADGFIWPYFYHSSEGIGVILLFLSATITVIAIGEGTFLLISRYKSKLR